MWNMLTGEILDAVWMKGLDVSNADVMSVIASSVGLDGGECVWLAQNDPTVKEKLLTQTNAALEAGVFGVPSILS